MKFSEWARKRPGLECADASDPRIAEVFESSGMRDGKWEIELRRIPTIAESYRRQGAQAYYLIYGEKPGQASMIASIVLRPVVREGVKSKIATIGDARVASGASGRAKAALRSIYRELLESFREIDEFREVSGIYTVVLAENRESLNAFARGRRGIRYESAAEVRTVVRAVSPLAKRLWDLDGVSRDYRIEFAPVGEPNASAGAIRDDFAAFALADAERVRVFDSAGREAASAIVWRSPVRQVEIRESPAIWTLGLRLLGISRSLAVKGISGFTWAEGLASGEKPRVQRAILREIFASGRVRAGELIMHASESAIRPSFWIDGFPRVLESRVFRVSLDSEPAPRERPRIELDPVFL